MIVAADEQLHEPGADEHWQESYYFNWADREGRSFGLARWGINPASGKIDGVLLTMRDGQPEFIYPAVGLDMGEHEHPPAEYGLRAKGLSFTMREPLARWHIGLAGRDTVDLTWTAFHDAHDYHDGLKALGAADEDLALAPAHFEQCGEVRGEVCLAGKAYEIEGLGHRDKSWGARDWNGITGWEWLSAQFGPDLAFNATVWYPPGAEETIPGGFVTRDGENRALVATGVDYEWTRLKHVPRSATIAFTDDQGESYTVRATALAQFPLFKKGLFIQETHARFELELDGETRTGLGVLEHAWHAGTRGTLERWHQFVPVVAMSVRQRLPF
jgi:hypothetical protein